VDTELSTCLPGVVFPQADCYIISRDFHKYGLSLRLTPFPVDLETQPVHIMRYSGGIRVYWNPAPSLLNRGLSTGTSVGVVCVAIVLSSVVRAGTITLIRTSPLFAVSFLSGA